MEKTRVEAYVGAGLYERMEAFRERQRPKVSRTALVECAIERFLDEEEAAESKKKRRRA